MIPAIIIKDQLIKIFSSRDEISEVQIFGKLAENKADKYSDVDIRVISQDPYATQKDLKELISTISPIRETYILASDENTYALMFMLKNYTPYQKIDIGIQRKGYGIQFSNITTVYSKESKVNKNRDFDIVSTEKTVDYNLKNFLFGIPRITKCFFRNDFDMYRRWISNINAFMSLLYEKYFGWQEISEMKAPNAPNSKLLLEQLTSKDRKRFESILPLDRRPNIEKGLLNMLIWFIELSYEKSENLNIPINQSFSEFIINWTTKEIRKL